MISNRIIKTNCITNHSETFQITNEGSNSVQAAEPVGDNQGDGGDGGDDDDGGGRPGGADRDCHQPRPGEGGETEERHRQGGGYLGQHSFCRTTSGKSQVFTNLQIFMPFLGE